METERTLYMDGRSSCYASIGWVTTDYRQMHPQGTQPWNNEVRQSPTCLSGRLMHMRGRGYGIKLDYPLIRTDLSNFISASYTDSGRYRPPRATIA